MTSRHLIINHAAMWHEASHRIWCCSQERDTPEDGVGRWAHFFPGDIFSWRAAEYGFDPSDQDGLLDVVFYEPYLTDVPDPAFHHLHVDNAAKARDYHWKRIKAAKGSGQLRGAIGPSPDIIRDGSHRNWPWEVDTGDDEDPLEVLASYAWPMRADHLEVRQEYVAEMRHVVRRRLAREADSTARMIHMETAAELRGRLWPSTQGRSKADQRSGLALNAVPRPQPRKAIT